MLGICEIWPAEKFVVWAASLANTGSGWNKTNSKTNILEMKVEEKFYKGGN